MKAYIFYSTYRDDAIDFVRSNNLSKSGIAGGIEWAIGAENVSPMRNAFVTQASGRPILMLDREHNPELPAGDATFVADGAVYVGSFRKVALNVARRQGSGENALAELLRT